ncbi:hypothetical protein R3P38DRAFT_3313383 [Favolaschia claudopus]|uniref:Uncharacterized protein n=1 Tax=Favolaschia claudopus TaxID=2862362 RepID=A0AAW0C435_9AGAR
MFPTAADLPLSEIKAYRAFAFPDALSNPAHNPYFSVEDAPTWITSQGFQLYLEHSSNSLPTGSDPNDFPTRVLKAYRNYVVYFTLILAEEYHNHPFFGLENSDAWINPVPFQLYAQDSADAPAWRGRARSVSSVAPSRAASLLSITHSRLSRSSSRAAIVPTSRSQSPASFRASASNVSSRATSQDSIRETDYSSRSSSAMDIIEISSDSEPELPPAPKIEDVSQHPIIPVSTSVTASTSREKGKARKETESKVEEITITRQCKVHEIIHMTTVPSTFSIPRSPTAILLDISSSAHLLRRGNGKKMQGSIIFGIWIRIAHNHKQNMEAWSTGSGGHKKGDVDVHGFTTNLKEKFNCRRVDLTCKGVDICEFLDPDLFAGHERYEPDEEQMQFLWNHELEQNEAEAASHIGIMARFYTRIQKSKCRIECDGVPVLVPLSKGPSKYGKKHFVGCSKYRPSERGQHRYAALAANHNEVVLQFLIENGGVLPADDANTGNENTRCSLTVHPRVGLRDCRMWSFSHIINNKIEPAKILHRLCPSRLIIFVPVDPVPPALQHKVMVVVEKPHNHPMHPKHKPNTEDKLKLHTAMQASGINGLTVQKLLNASSTSAVYGGKRVADESPAYADTQKVRKAISAQKKIEHPRGMGWDGLLYYLNTREIKLATAERYIHTAMNKNGFKLVVTMHPQIAVLIHRVRYLGIDYTFKRVDGVMDEWEVGGFVDRYNQRLTLASLYCDKQNTDAFTQLFTEFFHVIRHISGEAFKLAPFYPDAKCRVVILDGEIPQALGLGSFLVEYNDPAISGIRTREPTELLRYCLKICSVHFERHIDELPDHIPKSVIQKLKSIMGLSTRAEIDEWKTDVDRLGETYVEIKNWKDQKDRNSFLYSAINKFESKIAPADYDTTPNQSNLIETAHAARNAETGIHLPILEAILKAQERDNIKVQELALIDRNGVMPRRWNGAAGREKHAAQRRLWAARKTATRNDQLTSYDALKQELAEGNEENKTSLGRQKDLEAEIKALQADIQVDKHRSDFKERINALRGDIEAEKSERREWVIRRQELNKELERLRKGGLAGVRINGRRPDRPEGEEMSIEAPSPMVDSMPDEDFGLGIGAGTVGNSDVFALKDSTSSPPFLHEGKFESAAQKSGKFNSSSPEHGQPNLM